MRRIPETLLFAVLMTAICGTIAAAEQNDGMDSAILALERKALDGWQAGNPDPALAVLDPDITYFHMVTDKRLDGIAAVKALFLGYRGVSLFDSYEMADPKVQVMGNIAVLTYILVRHARGETTRWNATQVYQRKSGDWRIVHSHWSAIAQR